MWLQERDYPLHLPLMMRPSIVPQQRHSDWLLHCGRLKSGMIMLAAAGGARFQHIEAK
jgi:hypothetical protein